MLRHYLLVAMRNFRRNPLSTALKLLALSLGLVSFLSAHAIGDYLRQSDRHWTNAGRIHVVLQYLTPPGASAEQGGLMPGAAAPTARYLQADFPELEAVARHLMNTIPVQAEGANFTYNAIAADPAFTRIFDLTPVAGDVSSLDAPGVALLEESAAREMFGGQDPVGRTLTLGPGIDVTVTGVFAPLPEPTLLDAVRMIVPMSTFDDFVNAMFSQGGVTAGDGGPIRFSESELWNNANFFTSVLLPEDGSLSGAELERRMQDFAARHVPPEAGTARYEVKPLGDLAAMAIDRQIFGSAQGVSLVGLLYILGALVLAVACLDFSNLATAQADSRAKEIGLRRTLGATQRQIAVQTLFETALIAVAALILVLPLTLLVAAPTRALTGLDMHLPGLMRLDYWLSVIAILGAAVLLAGAWPALVLARIRPVLAMRAGKRGAGGVRSLLIVAQFAVASFLAIVVAVMLAQKADLRRSGLGAEEDLRLVIRYVSGGGVNVDTLKTELLTHPSILGVTYGTTPYARYDAMAEFAASPEPGAPRIAAQSRGVAADYFATTGIGLLAGREFSPERDVLNGDPMTAVIDVETAALLGFAPGQAVGRTIYQSSRPGEAGAPETMRPVTVVGVAEQKPLEFVTVGDVDNYIYSYTTFALQPEPIVRISRQDAPAALAHIDATWSRLYPDVEMTRLFLDEVFDQSFRMFSMLNSVVIGLSAVAVVIAAMGLFGMASFIAQRRLHEVGVRKTLGASTPRVLRLMLWDFSRPVLLANLIAWPFAWIVARLYLNLFVTRIPLTPAPFLLSLAGILLVAWLAVGAHALRAARVKPALVLKAE